MADVKFSDFVDGTELLVGDIVVGLRGGVNYKFDFPSDGFKDSSSNYLMQYASAGASSVNYPYLINSLTTVGVTYGAGGSDADININITPKGTGKVALPKLDINSTVVLDGVIDDDTFATASATTGATSESIKAYVDNSTGGKVDSVSGILNRITSTGGNTPVIDISASYVGQASITILGTISTGVWNGTLIGSTYGGTGVNNGSSTITIGGNFEMSGAHTFVGTLTGNTAVTFPTSGTLLTSAGAVTSLAGTANQITASAATGAVTLAIASNAVLPGTGGVTIPTGNTAQQAGIAGTMRFNSQTSVFEGTADGATWDVFTTAAGTVVSVSGTADRITSTGGTTPVIDIASTYVGQSSITTLGTIATGVWNGTAVTVPYGGTDKTSFTAYAPIFGGTTSTGALQQTAALTDGQLLIGSTGALPSAATLTAGDGISITNGAGSITVTNTGGASISSIFFLMGA